MRRPLLALTALAFAAAIASGGPPGASAGGAGPSVAACALGTSAPDLRGFAARELARAQRRVRGGRRTRRAFTAAAAAYLYGVAPLSVGQTVQRFPENRMLSIGALVDPTVKTVAQLNLAAGPLVIDVPDTRGRYYVLQLLDAYSNTFRYVGRRTTGTGAGSYALVPPAFSGALPPGVRRITSPTPLVWLLGRTLIQGAADLPSVTELMRGYRVTPLAEWSAGAREPPLVLPAFPPNQTRLVLPKGLAFFDALGAYLAATAG